MIKLMIPDMPTADEVLPFLREIDANKRYSNGGPLVQRLEGVLSEYVGAPVAAVSSATLALELALKALKLPRGSHVLVPAFTFAATGMAVWNAQMRPVLCDVDPDTWQLTPEIAAKAADGLSVRAVVPVAPFGHPVSVEAWDRFSRDTRIAVVVDAAGGVLAQPAGNLKVAYSLHATKFIGCGEGGFLASNDRLFVERIRHMGAFGHWGTNAKLSEYSAAVGLAAANSDRVARKREATQRVIDGYARWFPVDHVKNDGTILSVLLPPGHTAVHVCAELARRGVESKRWYAPFLDDLAQFKGCPIPTTLRTTTMLRERLLGLPFHTQLTDAEIDAVGWAVKGITS